MDKPTSEMLQSFDVLRQTSILIFGVVGAWIAVLFPMLYADSTQNSEKRDSIKKLLHKLFLPITFSLYIVTITLVVPILISIAQKIPIPYCIIPCLRGSLFGMICVLTAFQLYAIILALDPFDFVKTKSSIEKEKNDSQERYKKKR